MHGADGAGGARADAVLHLHGFQHEQPVARCHGLPGLDVDGKHPAWPKTLPAIVLLDLNLPGTDGRMVLQQLKQHATLHTLPVIVFTTSTNSRDIEECYRLGANSYLTKPIEYAVLEEKVRLIIRYWLEMSELPTIA